MRLLTPRARLIDSSAPLPTGQEALQKVRLVRWPTANAAKFSVLAVGLLRSDGSTLCDAVLSQTTSSQIAESVALYAFRPGAW